MAEDISKYLGSQDFLANYYHGGIANDIKQKRLLQWQNEQKEIMVATTAFGMGIDKANVKSIIHFNLPESLESYYQEAGRAGRNGSQATALLLYHGSDETKLKNQFLNNLPSIAFIKKVYNKLCNYFQVSYGEGENEVFQLDFKQFCNTYDLKASLTYNVLQTLDRQAIIALNQNFDYKTTLQFITTNRDLFRYLESNLELNTLVKTLLRTYGGVFDYETSINLALVARKCNLSETIVVKQLRQLEKDHIISLQLTNTDSEIVFLKPREDDLTINPIVKSVKERYQQKHDQIESVLTYIKNDSICKQQLLLKYFGEKLNVSCGKCLVCLKKDDILDEHIDNVKVSILERLQNVPMSSRTLLDEIKCDQKVLLDSLKALVASDKIKINKNNTYSIL